MKTAGVLGLAKPQFGTNEEEGAGTLGAILESIDTEFTTPRLVTNYAANAAITQKEGTVTISKGSAGAFSLADPVSGTQVGGVGDDGRILRIVSKTAFAHVLTIAGGIAGGALNTVTLGGAIGDTVELQAIAGKWYLRPSINATASTV